MSLPDLPGLRDLAPYERSAFVDMAERLGADPSDVAYVVGYETGARTPFSPAARNPLSGATGLIQFTKETAEGLGTSLAALARMSFVEQLEFVERYLARFRGRLTSLSDVYLAVFWPAAVGKPDSYVVARQDADGYEGLVYEQNKQFDRRGLGYYTRGDVVAEVREFAAAHSGRLGGSLSAGASIAVGAVAGLSLVWYLQRRGVHLDWLR